MAPADYANLDVAVDLIALGVLALILSYAFVWGLRRWAGNTRLLDVPNERSSHVKPVPRGGGLAIVCLSLLGWAMYMAVRGQASSRIMLGYMMGAVLVAAASLLDDMRSLPVRARIIVHSIAALLAILVLGYWQEIALPLAGPVHLGWPGAIVTFVWIVGLTNAYNFMDGIDGIAGIQAVIAGLVWAMVGLLLQQPSLSVLGTLLLATSAGFLGHNWHPARIFMGDVGSAFLGFTFAVLPMLSASGDTRLAVVGLLAVWPFVFDATLTLVRRLLKGENVFAAHRSHLYQRLVIAGRSHRFVTVLYGCLDLTGLVLALAWFLGIGDGFILPCLAMLCAGLWAFVVREERRRLARRAASSTQSGTLQS